MIVISEATEQTELSTSAKENKLMTETAQLLGFKVYYIPPDFQDCGTAENALWHIPQYAEETQGILVGYIPELERYQAIYQAALDKGIKLLNNPLEHQIAQEFDMFYPLLQGLTPESVIITSTDECIKASELLGFPVFVKGAIQSRKQQGWKSCVANNLEELTELTAKLLKLKYAARDRIIVRKLVNLRYQRFANNGFPMGREFRCFIYNHQILKYGYYWDGKDDLSKLSTAEEEQVLNLAILASQRLQVPYIAVDIGQLESGEWIVIEIGDGQFSGLSQISPLELWNKLGERVQ
ncbi:ATP-grasp domain-containing protein [Anabaena sphaerica FACHB-251]|uniref:ATP-grasp domain-containing protein n=1 Tax=Anabaena sphaerica FACHB-251 TaxID=2692883 RepID=A0A926ZYM6_9NOST|nr:ATP-grasp domain-containing protein [Anabaena sphaerica]MBD2292837.1 ATP-grasp domain-containing protein [Anabaena sphaerica FACHB-251]